MVAMDVKDFDTIGRHGVFNPAGLQCTGAATMQGEFPRITQNFPRRRKFIIGLVSFSMPTGTIEIIFVLWQRCLASGSVLVEARCPEAIRIKSVHSDMSDDVGAFCIQIEMIISCDALEGWQLDSTSDLEFNAQLQKGFSVRVRTHMTGALNALYSTLSGMKPEAITSTCAFNEAVDALLDHLEIAPVGRSRVIRISATASNNARATQITNAVADAYTSFLVGQRWKATEQAHLRIGQCLLELQRKVAESADAGDRFRAKNGLVHGQRREAPATGDLRGHYATPYRPWAPARG